MVNMTVNISNVENKTPKELAKEMKRKSRILAEEWR